MAISQEVIAQWSNELVDRGLRSLSAFLVTSTTDEWVSSFLTGTSAQTFSAINGLQMIKNNEWLPVKVR